MTWEAVVSPEVLGDLANVDEGSPSDGQALVFDDGTWVPGDAGNGGDSGAFRGEDVIDDPDTDVVVTHGLPRAPEPGEIQVQPRNVDHDVVRHAVHTETASEFTVEVDPAPGGTHSFEFGWLWVPASEGNGNGEFSPDDIDDLALWWDGRDLTAGRMDAPWIDRSSAENNSQVDVTEDRRPTAVENVLNGHPVARFDASVDAQRLDTTTDLNMVPGTLFVVGRYTSADAFQQIASNTSTNIQLRFETAADKIRVDAASSGNALGNPEVGGVEINTFYVLELWASSSEAQCVRSGTGGTVTSHSNTNNIYNRFGVRAATNEPLTGDIAAILFYDRALDAGERSQVRDYIGDVWDLTISS